MQALQAHQVTAALELERKRIPRAKGLNKHGALWMTLMSQEGGWYGCRALTTKMAEEYDAQEMALESMNDTDISSLHLCLSMSGLHPLPPNTSGNAVDCGDWENRQAQSLELEKPSEND